LGRAGVVGHGNLVVRVGGCTVLSLAELCMEAPASQRTEVADAEILVCRPEELRGSLQYRAVGCCERDCVRRIRFRNSRKLLGRGSELALESGYRLAEVIRRS